MEWLWGNGDVALRVATIARSMAAAFASGTRAWAAGQFPEVFCDLFARNRHHEGSISFCCQHVSAIRMAKFSMFLLPALIKPGRRPVPPGGSTSAVAALAGKRLNVSRVRPARFLQGVGMNPNIFCPRNPGSSRAEAAVQKAISGREIHWKFSAFQGQVLPNVHKQAGHSRGIQCHHCRQCILKPRARIGWQVDSAFCD